MGDMYYSTKPRSSVTSSASASAAALLYVALFPDKILSSERELPGV